jgi:hypothetical protein
MVTARYPDDRPGDRREKRRQAADVKVRPTRRWREPDSNHRSRSCERLFWALPIGDGGTKGGPLTGSGPKTAMLAWSGCPKPFPSRRDREFESVFLQRRVRCEPISPEGSRTASRRFGFSHSSAPIVVKGALDQTEKDRQRRSITGKPPIVE